MPATELLNAALSGRYSVERRIGEGGMATVYLARDLRHHRSVALKVLKPDLGAVVGEERFLSEIQVTANLQHPNLLPLFDSGATNGLLFYVMPFVEGESLRARLEREKQLPIDEAVRLSTAIASALDYAHRHGVIHRDLKPENILMHEDQPLIADFGIALAVSRAGGNRITQTGLSLGTPQYMSPEQATGDRAIDGRTDIYSLGAVTYEMLTGEPPHTGNTAQAVIARVLTDTPRPMHVMRPTVPEHVEAAVERALEKLPADRWATAKEFSEAMQGARSATRPTSARLARGARRGRPSSREIAAWTLAVLATGAAAALAARGSRAPAGPPVDFEITLPESVVASTRASAASVAISRDGTTIIFQATHGNDDVALWTRRLDDHVAHRVPGTDSARGVAISADGSEATFSNISTIGTTGGAIKRILLGGGTARVIIPDAASNGQVSWSDDGRILFAKDFGIWMTDADATTPTRILAADSAHDIAYGYPDPLPGGKAALVSYWKAARINDSLMVGVLDIGSGKVTPLHIRGANPKYSGTGHLLYVTSDGVLFAVPFNARSRKVTGPAFQVAAGVAIGSGGAAAFSVARNGTLVYLPGESTRGLRVLYAVARTGHAERLPAPDAFYLNPRVSPDGQQIALTLSTMGSLGPTAPDVWRYDFTAHTLTRVTTDSQSQRAVWLDDQRLAFVHLTDSNAYMSPLYTTGKPQTLMGLHGRLLEFSAGPPHTWAAIRTSAMALGSNDIWLAPLDSLSAAKPLLAEAYSEDSPQISRDGRLLAYVTNRTGRAEVYVRPLPNGPETQVSVAGGSEPVWSRDGRELFYRDPTSMVSAHLARSARVTVTQRETLFTDRGIYMRSPLGGNYDVMRDGRFVMVGLAHPLSASQPMVVKLNWQVRSGR